MLILLKLCVFSSCEVELQISICIVSSKVQLHMLSEWCIAEMPLALHHSWLWGACKRSHSLTPRALSLFHYPDSHFMFPLQTTCQNTRLWYVTSFRPIPQPLESRRRHFNLNPCVKWLQSLLRFRQSFPGGCFWWDAPDLLLFRNNGNCSLWSSLICIAEMKEGFSGIYEDPEAQCGRRNDAHPYSLLKIAFVLSLSLYIWNLHLSFIPWTLLDNPGIIFNSSKTLITFDNLFLMVKYR